MGIPLSSGLLCIQGRVKRTYITHSDLLLCCVLSTMRTLRHSLGLQQTLCASTVMTSVNVSWNTVRLASRYSSCLTRT
ncbi:gp19.2 [Escherichia phage 13a]|uniref:Gp19.2 n=1 Tax=Escherichia phage 13a TaxID=532076 RepID=B3VD80_9CAUD|nr:gp19.2 [Escherichia phage 13a]ACF15934.1 gp19.2 [Escherichia phage 13a]